MDYVLTVAEGSATDLSTLVSSFTSEVGTQFAAAAPAVVGAAAAIAVVIWGVPKLIGFFKKAAH